MDTETIAHQPLLSHLYSIPSCVNVNLRDPDWFRRWAIPSEPGWYFARMYAPVGVLQRLHPQATIYTTKKNQIEAKVKNIDIQSAPRVTQRRLLTNGTSLKYIQA